MRFFFIFLLIIFSNCSVDNKKVYMCGERECVDKKEVDEYFAKNIAIEVLIKEEKKNKSVDLVKLNLNTENKKKYDKSNKKSSKKALKDKKKTEREKIKKELIERRKVAKIKAKKEQKLSKIKKKKDKKEILKKIKKTKSKDKTKENNNEKEIVSNKICLVLNKCDIDEIAEHLKKIGEKKAYPDISKY